MGARSVRLPNIQGCSRLLGQRLRPDSGICSSPSSGTVDGRALSPSQESRRSERLRFKGGQTSNSVQDDRHGLQHLGERQGHLATRRARQSQRLLGKISRLGGTVTACPTPLQRTGINKTQRKDRAWTQICSRRRLASGTACWWGAACGLGLWAGSNRHGGEIWTRPLSKRAGYVLTGLVAGRFRAAPEAKSNLDPCIQHSIVRSATSPSDRGTAAWVHSSCTA